MPRSRRRWLHTAALVAITFAAAGCQALNLCDSDSGTPPPTAPTAAPKAATSPTAASTAAPKATSTGTTAATGASASTGAAGAFSGTLQVGFDHPPFAAGAPNVGGASHGLACGKLTGVPGGSTVTLTLSGGTGQPASATATTGTDGSFLATFPIQQFGPLSATIAGVKNPSGATLTGSVPAANATVAGGADLACPR